MPLCRSRSAAGGTVEPESLAIFAADLAAQQAAIDRIFAALNQRASGLTPDNIEKLESVAYQLHNLYGAVEELLKTVATYFENNISDSTRWHSLLLQRMTQSVKGIRPAVLSQQSYELLNALRGFRHFFRHAYGVPLDFAQLQSNLNKAQQLKLLLEADLAFFMEQLQQTPTSQTENSE